MKKRLIGFFLGFIFILGCDFQSTSQNKEVETEINLDIDSIGVLMQLRIDSAVGVYQNALVKLEENSFEEEHLEKYRLQTKHIQDRVSDDFRSVTDFYTRGLLTQLEYDSFMKSIHTDSVRLLDSLFRYRINRRFNNPKREVKK